jgi:hypothetical protein
MRELLGVTVEAYADALMTWQSPRWSLVYRLEGRSPARLGGGGWSAQDFRSQVGVESIASGRGGMDSRSFSTRFAFVLSCIFKSRYLCSVSFAENGRLVLGPKARFYGARSALAFY